MRGLFALAFILVGALCASAQTQTPAPGFDPGRDPSVRRQALADIAAQVESADADLLKLRTQVRELRNAAEATAAPVRTRRAQIQADLERLGPPPGEDDPPEAAEVAAERERLNAAFAAIDGVAIQSELNIAEADRLLQEIALKRSDRFFSDLLDRSPSPLAPQTWTSGIRTFAVTSADAWRSIEAAFRARLAEEGADQGLIAFLAILATSVLAAWALRSRLDATIRQRISGRQPLPSRMVLVAAIRTAVRLLPGLVALGVLYAAFAWKGGLTPESRALAPVVFTALAGLLIVDAAAIGLLAPRLPDWRVLNLTTAQAIALRGLALSAAGLLAADHVLLSGSELYGGSVELLTIIRSVAALSLACVLFALCRPSLWRIAAPEGPAPDAQSETEAAPPRRSGDTIRVLGGALTAFVIVAVLTGYVALGHYVATRVFYLIAVFAAVWVVRALLREGVRLFDPRFRSRAALSPEEERQPAHFWIGFVINLATLALFAPLALLTLGAEREDVRDAAYDAFFGLRVGSVDISIATVLTALGVFVLVLYLTRLAQRMLETDVFPAARIDPGIQNSLTTLIGYAGLILAAMIGVATFGFDLSNLAIIAGALSVGIGFGLQSIVNNFVSGLILLFERPIKVGDWIITASGEGFVRQIGVRSTQIETFDRSSVIVPNSELVSGAVTNWTYRDKMGRIIVGVGVSYESDPEQVVKLLEEVAAAEPGLMTHPAPFVYFVGFGDSSLDFELRAYIWDISNVLTMHNKLRIAVFKKFREAGVEIPFPQRDIHIKGGAPFGGAST